MAAETQRRGMIRPISDLPALAGLADYIEVQQGQKFYKASPTQLGGNTVDLFTGYTAFQYPFNTDLLDASGHLPAGTVTNVTNAGGQAVFGGGAGGGISIVTTAAPALNVLSLGTQCFTMEGWFTSAQTAITDIISKTNVSLNTGCWIVVLNNTGVNSGLIGVYFGDVSSSAPIIQSVTTKWNDGVRHHIRIVRSGSRWSLYLDGVLNARGTSAVEVGDNGAAPALIFGNSVFARPFAGELDNWRFLPGIALNTINFTVPTPPFPVT